MKMKKILALMLSFTMVLSMAACGNSNNGGSADDNDAKTENTDNDKKDDSNEGGDVSGEKQDVSLRLWGAEEDQAMLQKMVDEFKTEYADYANFNIEIGVESEATAKDTVLTDIEAAADVFGFASDQLPDLVKAGALQSIDEMSDAISAYSGKTLDDIKAANAAGSVEAASYNGELYAFPATADNGYFLFYDSTKVTAEQAASWDTLLEAADAAGSKVGMVMASGWYNASFFIGAGFTPGTLNEDGSTNLDWAGTADVSGVEVVKAMANIASNGAFQAIPDGGTANAIASGELCAIITGTWDAIAAQDAFGDGYAATKLPTYTVGDKQIQQGSVAGYKFFGVNGHSENAGWATLLAEWLTNEANQATRFAEREVGPSNINAAASDAVKANVAIAALAEQSAYGVSQFVGGNFWDPTATFGEKIVQGQIDVNDDAAIQAALDEVVAGVTAPVGE